MPVFCAVVGCSSRSPRDKVSFFRFPSIYVGCGRRGRNEDAISPLAVERRKRWTRALRRENLSEAILRNQRVCSKHFIKGKPANFHDVNDPDWVPSVQMGYERKSSDTKRRGRKERLSPVKNDNTQEVEKDNEPNRKLSDIDQLIIDVLDNKSYTVEGINVTQTQPVNEEIRVPNVTSDHYYSLPEPAPANANNISASVESMSIRLKNVESKKSNGSLTSENKYLEEKRRLETQLLKLSLYKTKLQCLKLEESMGLPTSEFTKAISSSKLDVDWKLTGRVDIQSDSSSD